MNYELATDKYLAIRKEVERIEKEAKVAVAELKKTALDLENWITLQAQADGLTTIKTSLGTAYWTTHNTASVASREALFEYCKEHDAWDLIESRASKTAVRSFIEGNGAPPPGVNFSSIQVFNLRRATQE